MPFSYGVIASKIKHHKHCIKTRKRMNVSNGLQVKFVNRTEDKQHAT